MRTNLTHLTHALALTLGLALTTSAQAVVESGHWTSYFADRPDDNFSVGVDQTIAGDYTGLFMRYEAGRLTGITHNVDEGADLFLVQAGTEFSQASIAAGAHTFVEGVSRQFGDFSSAVALPVGTDFYLATRTRTGSDPGFSYTPEGMRVFTVFGWAHFVVDAQGAPRIVDSAMAFQEGGIVVGSLQAIPAIPEPATGWLMGLGLGAVTWRARLSRR